MTNNQPFFTELLNRFREDIFTRQDKAVYQEWCRSLERATAAMIEAEVGEEVLKRMLMKYWDLRPSEAKLLIETNPGFLDK